MTKQHQYISNCINRIFKSKISPKNHKRVCDLVADAVDEASENGIAFAHSKFIDLLKDAEAGKFTSYAPQHHPGAQAQG